VAAKNTYNVTVKITAYILTASALNMVLESGWARKHSLVTCSFVLCMCSLFNAHSLIEDKTLCNVIEHTCLLHMTTIAHL